MSSSSPNFDPRIELYKLIDAFMKDVDDHSLMDEGARISEIVKKINELSNRVDVVFYTKISNLRDKLKKVGSNETSKLDGVIERVGKTAQLIGVRDVSEELMDYLHPSDLMALYTNKNFSPLVIKKVIERINHDKIPLMSLNLEYKQLVEFIGTHGKEIEYYNFMGFDQEGLKSFFLIFPLRNMALWCPHLKELVLAICDITQAEILEIADASLQLPEFKILNLRFSSVTDEAFLALARLINLEELDLTLTISLIEIDHAIEPLTIALRAMPSLRKLGLMSNYIGLAEPQAFGLFSNALKSLILLEHLDFANNQISAREEVAEEMWALMIDAIRELRELKFLDLSSNTMTPPTVLGLANAVSTLSKLTTLILNNMRLENCGPEAVRILFQAIGTRPLKVLGLARNSLGLSPENLRSLINLLGNLPHLETVDLWNNKLGKNFTPIVEALEKCTNLRILRLNDNDLDSSHMQDLIGLGKKLKKAEYILLSGNRLTEENIKEMNRVATGVDSLGQPLKKLFRMNRLD